MQLKLLLQRTYKILTKVKFCKYLLRVNKKASNLAVNEELGRYSYFIYVVLSMVRYWVVLNDTKIRLLYLLLSNFEHRKILSQFRISAHRLEKEHGSYLKHLSLVVYVSNVI